MASTLPELFLHDKFDAEKQMLQLVGGTFRFRSKDGRLLGYCRQKAFRLREDITVFADEGQTVPLLKIEATQIIDFDASYRVLDAQTGELYGSLRRKGWSSLLRDSWEILDPQNIPRGKILEDSGWKAMVRRLVDLAALLLPQTFLIEVNQQVVGTLEQNRWGIPPRYSVDLSLDRDNLLPRPLAIAATILLLAIEGHQ